VPVSMTSVFSVGTECMHILMQDLADPEPLPRKSHLEDPELAHAVSLSLKVCSMTLCVFEFKTKSWSCLT
jgi:hypothetical protein